MDNKAWLEENSERFTARQKAILHNTMPGPLLCTSCQASLGHLLVPYVRTTVELIQGTEPRYENCGHAKEYIDAFMRWSSLEDRPDVEIDTKNVVARALLSRVPPPDDAATNTMRVPFWCSRQEPDGQKSVNAVPECCLAFLQSSLWASLFIEALA